MKNKRIEHMPTYTREFDEDEESDDDRLPPQKEARENGLRAEEFAREFYDWELDVNALVDYLERMAEIKSCKKKYKNRNGRITFRRKEQWDEMKILMLFVHGVGVWIIKKKEMPFDYQRQFPWTKLIPYGHCIKRFDGSD